MKRMIRAAKSAPILESENFVLVKESGIGMQNTPWEGLDVKSRGLADKHVVRIDLHTAGVPIFEGDPVKYRYDDDCCEVSHGMRMKKDTLEDTAEYIDVLEEALAFAQEINEWIKENPDY